jgi:GDPmannose 4,6-dehydratase
MAENSFFRCQKSKLFKVNNKVLIVGDKGQDGTYLRQSLLNKKYQVIGISRDHISYYISGSDFSTKRRYGKGAEIISDLIVQHKPAEIYYLAAYHKSSEQEDEYIDTIEYSKYHEVNVNGFLECLSAIRMFSGETRIFYASSSLIFDGSNGTSQDENTQYSPAGFYGITKAQGLLLAKEYRKERGLFAVGGILYNHESVLRKPQFLSNKIIKAAIRAASGEKPEIYVGDLFAEVDWGYAPDYVEAFQMAIRQDRPDDYIIATGETHTVQEFASIAFNCFSLNYAEYVKENGSILKRKTKKKVGDYSKLKASTGWSPNQNFQRFVELLVDDYLMFNKNKN